MRFGPAAVGEQSKAALTLRAPVQEALVPQLRAATPYPGGLLLLEMELLDSADGWVRLGELGHGCSDWGALERQLLQQVELFAGADSSARRVHGDLRAPNVLVRFAPSPSS